MLLEIRPVPSYRRRPVTPDWQRTRRALKLAPSRSLPENADAITRMRHRLQTESGRSLYARRKTTIEPVFGIIKAVMGFRQFLLRGIDAVSAEWDLVCIAYNIKKLHTSVA